MGKVGYRFLILFFSWFGALIVFINFVGWSGAYINVSSGGNVDWTNSYFGFESVSLMIRTLNQTMNAIPLLSIKNFTKHLNDFLDSCAFGIPQMLESIGSGGNASLDAILKLLVMVFGGQPLILIGNLCLVVAHVFYYALNFVAIVMLALGGRFNIQFDNPITPSTVANLVEYVRITVPVLV